MTKQGIVYPQLSSGTLTPAYGRDYSTKAEVIKDFRENKDFQFHNERSSILCSIRDGVIGELVKLRYNNQREVLFYTITAADFVSI